MAERLNNTIETQINDGNTIVSQIVDNNQPLQTVIQDVPQVQTVLQNGINVSSQINAPFVEVTSVNGKTGDVITEPVVGVFEPNHYYLKNTMIGYNNNLYYAKETFTSGSSFNANDWHSVEGSQITVDSALSTTSENPVQNKVITSALNNKVNSSDLAEVATSGSFTDLINVPVFPTVNNGTLTIQKNGTTINTFTANSSTNKTANITVPTKTSEIENDSDFLATEDLFTTKSGTNINFTESEGIPLSTFSIKGNTSQNGTPTPDAPVAVQTVTGENVVKISDGQGNEQSYEVNLGNIELCKIGTYQDYIYKSGSDWKIHKAVGKYQLDGTINWYANGTNNYQCTRSGDNKLYLATSATGLSNYFNVSNSSTGINMYPITQTGTDYIRITNAVSEWASTDLFKTFLTNNAVYLYYPLAESAQTDTEITNEALVGQLEAILSQGYTHAGTNNITTIISAGNAQGELEITYPKFFSKIATTSSLGSIRVGDGLDITSTGTLSTKLQFVDGPSAEDIDWSLVINKIYPVGSIYISTTLDTVAKVKAAFGGTWIAWGSGRVPIGVDSSQTEFNSVEKTGGNKTHTHGLTNGYAKLVLKGNGQVRYQGRSVAAWTDNYYVPSAGSGGSGSDSQGHATNLDGSTNAGSSLQPYITCYMYKRTA